MLELGELKLIEYNNTCKYFSMRITFYHYLTRVTWGFGTTYNTALISLNNLRDRLVALFPVNARRIISNGRVIAFTNPWLDFVHWDSDWQCLRRDGWRWLNVTKNKENNFECILKSKYHKKYESTSKGTCNKNNLPEIQ